MSEACAADEWPLCVWCLAALVSPIEMFQTHDDAVPTRDLWYISDARQARAEGITLFRINGQLGPTLTADTLVAGDAVCVFHLHRSLTTHPGKGLG